MIPSPLTRLDFSTPRASGSVYPHGAHVTAWAPAGESNALWVSREAILAPNVAIRGGVPLCFPWFGKGRSTTMSPSHGFARITPWALVSHSDSTAIFELSSTSILKQSHRSQFPYEFTAHFSVHYGQALELRLSVRNDGTAPFSYEEALHTYLRVGDVRDVSVDGLSGAPYTDHTAVPVREHIQEGELRFTGQTDRIYTSSADIHINDPVLERTLIVERENSSAAVIWNPWAENAVEIADMGDDEWPHMLCVEAANLGDQAVTLRPHASHTLAYRLRIEH